MSAVYEKTIATLGLTDDHQGELGYLHALLKYAHANHSGADVLSNPFAEVIRRFEAAGLNPHALERIRKALNDVKTRYNAGSIR